MTSTQGERVKSIRKELGLTLEKFGEKLGVGKNAISQIETGKNNLSEQMKRGICREYHVNPAYLEQGDGDMFVEANSDAMIAEWAAKVMKDKPESFRKRLVSAMSTWTEEDWVWVEKQAKAIIDSAKKEP